MKIEFVCGSRFFRALEVEAIKIVDIHDSIPVYISSILPPNAWMLMQDGVVVDSNLEYYPRQVQGKTKEREGGD